jgi:putative salt-induced outer membrane protein YdiY
MSQHILRAPARFPSLLLLLFFLSQPGLAKRHDLIVMKNGDRITGEVKKLEKGVLYIEPEYVSSAFGVDWFEVATINSTAGFQVVMNNGDRAEGTIEKVAAEQAPGADFRIRDGEREVSVSGDSVVNIESKQKSVVRQLKGAINLGYNFTSGNDQTQVSSDLNATYLSTAWSTGASFTSSFSGQSNASKTNLIDLSTFVERFLGSNSSVVGLGDFLHSSQQQLNLRTTLGGGYGHYWVRTNEKSFRSVFGAVYTHESFQSTAANPTQQNIEALLGVQYQLFQFSRYSLLSQLSLFPGISDIGRVRSTTRTTFSIKLINNFSTYFSFWDNFDSRPPVNAKKNELGISNSVGWTF